MAFLDLGDVRMHYELEQQASKDVLVFSHSLGSNLSMWEAQAEPLAQSFSILRYDGRGHGASSVTPYPYSVEQLANDLLGLLDSLGLRRICFCGLSLGGLIGQWLGVHAPDRLSKLVICNTAAKIGNEAGWNERIATVRREGLGTVAPGTLERWFTPGFRQSSLDETARIRAMLLSTDPEGYVASCAAVRDFDLREQVGSIRVPTMVVWGMQDPVTTPEDAGFLLRSIPGAQGLPLPAAHLSNVEAAPAFNRGLWNFLMNESIETAEAK